MKRIKLLVLAVLAVLGLASCGGGADKLVILNWGDYISEDVVLAFEEEYGVTVDVVTTDSNEQMYTSVLNRMADYDLVVPSDYMIHQMYENDLLIELDYTKLTNYTEDIFVSELQSLMDSDDCKAYTGYYVPYFWGSLGIMYNKQKSGVEEAVMTNGWDVLFDHSLLPAGSKVAMYASSRDALAAAELKYGYSLNTTNKTEIDNCMKLLKDTKFDTWGTDDLKTKVSQGNLDVALVYSGDFFDAYYSDIEAAPENVENYSIYAPTDANNVFFDGLVIPVTCTDVDMSHNFINFMLEHENSYTNAEFVGYCPTVQSVFDEIMADEEGWGDIIAIDAYNPTLILNTENSKAEVYKYLGSENYAYIEDEYTKVVIN